MENSWDRFVLLRICPAELEPDKVFCSTAVRMYKILEYNAVTWTLMLSIYSNSLPAMQSRQASL